MGLLAKKLRTFDYFTIGFGTMVGVGWLVIMDDWLARGGYLGAILGFAIGGISLLPIAYVYGRLVAGLPDAGSEITYTALVFPSQVSFATGWIMMLGYLVVCPWEAVAVGKIAGYIFPWMNTLELYRIAGYPIYLPHLVTGLALTAVITFVNYRGVELSARFQNWTTVGLLLLFITFSAAGLVKGSTANLAVPFSHGGLISVLLVVQIVPYFMVGFESVGKSSEEARPGLAPRSFFHAMIAAIVVGIIFYISVIGIVAYIHPWRSLLGHSFATSVAFETAFGQRWIVQIIFLAAILSLLKVFNGNFLAASRLLFALGRKNLIHSRWGQIHPVNQTPGPAIIAIGLVTAATAFCGQALIVPITEVGSMASALGWLAACAAYLRMDRGLTQRVIAACGVAVASLLVAIKLLPGVPGHFSLYEWTAFAAWCVLGFILMQRPRRILSTPDPLDR
jgi:APA family basic amino acid/polyamine antiporter